MDDSYTAYIHSAQGQQDAIDELKQAHSDNFKGWYITITDSNGNTKRKPLEASDMRGDNTPHWACGKVACDCDEQYENYKESEERW